MKKILIYTLAALSALTARAAADGDRRQALLDSIAANNTTLAALRARVAADKAGNRAELRLPDLDVDFGYLWAPAGEPPRQDFGVSQQLDWGTLTGSRRRLARRADERLERTYAVELQAVMAEADRALVNLTYSNRLIGELEQRVRLADEMAALYDTKYERGDTDRMTLNKMRLNRSMARAELQRAEAERLDVVADLKRLNGGRPVAYADTLYALPPLPPLADVLTRVVDAGAAVTAARAAIAEAREQVKLDRALALPALTVGVTGEYLKEERHTGVSLGLSLPVWGRGRAKVRQSRAALTSAELDLADAATQLTADVEQRYAAALRLQQTADGLRRDLEATDNAPLLRRALDAGRLSLPEYLLELSFYYEARTQWLQAERDAALARSALLMLLPQ